jgi:hypothetical protein
VPLGKPLGEPSARLRGDIFFTGESLGSSKKQFKKTLRIFGRILNITRETRIIRPNQSIVLCCE